MLVLSICLVVGIYLLSLLFGPSSAQTIKAPTETSLMVIAQLSADMNKGAQPTLALDAAVQRLNAVDISQCPPDFREAWVRFTSAMSLWQSEAATLPKSDLETIIQAFLNGLGGEADGGYGRVTRANDSRRQDAQAAHANLMAIAERYRKQ